MVLYKQQVQSVHRTMSSEGGGGSNTTTSKDGPCPLLMAEILPGLWIGNLQSLRELTTVQKRPRWTVISTLKSEKLLHFARSALQESAAHIERHIEWELSDDVQADFLSSRLEEILQVIDNAMMPTSSTAAANNGDERACLVHCAFGVSRSATVCAAWLMQRRNMSLQQALDAIRKVRPQVSPNMGFIAGLRALEQCHGEIELARARLKLPVVIKPNCNRSSKRDVWA